MSAGRSFVPDWDSGRGACAGLDTSGTCPVGESTSSNLTGCPPLCPCYSWPDASAAYLTADRGSTRFGQRLVGSVRANLSPPKSSQKMCTVVSRTTTSCRNSRSIKNNSFIDYYPHERYRESPMHHTPQGISVPQLVIGCWFNFYTQLLRFSR